MKTWFDSIPAKYRHLLIVLGVAVLGGVAVVVQANTSTILSNIPDWLAPTAGALITYGLLWVTKITKQYGNGSGDTVDPAPVETPAAPVEPYVPEPVVEAPAPVVEAPVAPVADSVAVDPAVDAAPAGD